VASPPPEEQRFTFDYSVEVTETESDADASGDEARELLARVEKVHAAATRRAARRTHAVEERWIDALFAPSDPTAPPAESEVPAERPLPPPAGEQSEEDEPEESLSIAQFYRRVRHALEGAFPDEVWVTGEIRGMREARGGHHYFELADHGAETNGRAAQQLEVACWARDWPPIAAQLAAAGVELEVGRVVRVRGRVSVWEGGGRLRFTLTGLDVEALLGSIAAARRQLLKTLETEGILDANRRLPVPLVPLRIGLVASPGTEGHRDFTGQLDRSGFAFEVHLEPSLVQGADAPAQLAAALKRLEAWSPDLVVVVRGGGARGDLAAFDAEVVARAIATAPFPVWSGVGHTGDRSVADEVANFSAITPTACGEAVVARVAAYYDEMRRRVGQLASLAGARLDAAKGRLAVRTNALVHSTHRQLDHRERAIRTAVEVLPTSTRRRLGVEGGSLAQRSERLSVGAARRLTSDGADLERCRQVLTAYDPERQLGRGWSLTHTAAGRLLRSVGEVTAGEAIVTRLQDGSVTSVVSPPTAREDGRR